jgi:hypothetical protein
MCEGLWRADAMSKPLTPADTREEAVAMELLTRFRGKPQRVSGFPAGQAALHWLEGISGEKAGASPAAMVAKLKARWPEIVGQRLADVCRPERLSAGTLTLKCLPAAAPMLGATSVEIVGLIRLAGFASVRGLRLVHVPKSAFDAGATGKGRRHRPKPLPASQQQALDTRLAAITDPGLRQAMQRLAESVNGIE